MSSSTALRLPTGRWGWRRGAKLRRYARCVAQRLAPGSWILLYHRIAVSATDPWSLCVSPDHFVEHLEVLRGRVVPLTALAGGEPMTTSMARRFAMTFDDGYTDALTAARPLLERHDTPATVFVATHGVDAGQPFWWDELAGSIAPQRELPPRLQLRVRGVRHDFELEASGEVHTARGTGAHHAWPAPRARLHRALHDLLGGLDASERREQLDALRAWAGAPKAAIAAARALDRGEIVRLAADGLVEIGAHTVSHPHLPSLPVDVQEREIRDSQAFLSALLARPVTSFAYPHGSHDAGTRRLLRATGFARACTTRSGCVRRHTDPLRLPRLVVPDVDGDAFARILHRLGF